MSDVATASAELLPDSWRPRDLSTLLTGDYEPLQPTVARRCDGTFLLYRGRTHSVASEPEGGKTWLALGIAQQEMSQGNRVVFIDFEDTEEGIVGRLRDLGVDAEVIGQRFVYIRPDESISDTHPLLAFISEVDPALVIIDGVTEAMTIEGLSLTDNQQVAEFFSRLPTPLARLGPAVLLLDHEVKRQGDRNRFALGAGHKLGAISGVAFRLMRQTPFAVGRTGFSKILVSKDRPGQVARHTLDGYKRELIGYLEVVSAGTGIVKVDIKTEVNAVRTLDRLAETKKKMVDAMGSHTYNTKGDVKALVSVAGATKVQALQELIDEGYVSEKPFKVLEPYPRDADSFSR